MTRRGRRTMKLSAWAALEGINLRTAQRMAQRGDLPVPHFTTDTGRVMVTVQDEGRQPLTAQEMTEMLFALKRQLNRIEAKLDEVTV